jgi:hypothetical protein
MGATGGPILGSRDALDEFGVDVVDRLVRRYGKIDFAA